MDVSYIGHSLSPPWDKDFLNKKIKELGRDEVVNRFSWLFGEPKHVVDDLIEQFLTDNFIDDQGVLGGHYFWGNL